MFRTVGTEVRSRVHGGVVTLLLLGSLSLCVLPGCFYAKVRIPLDTDVQSTQLGSKVGEASIQSVLGIVAWGDAGTRAAATNGGITTVTHLDQELFNILGFVYARQTTIAYGD